MNISKLASTVILVTSFATLFLFLIIFHLLYDGSVDNLKDALSVTASFFGGITTLVAAYIATQLFNDWRAQQRHINSFEFARIVLNSYRELDRHFTNLQDCLSEQLEILKIAEEEKDNEVDELVTINELLDMGYQYINLFYFFHDDLLNYCYVSQSQIEINSIFENWEKNVLYFFERLNCLNSESSNQDLINIIEELTSDAFDTFVVDFNIEFNKIVLKPLRLED